ncbi:MAG: zinc finger domain-containing protein, partial [Desulfobulbaceae bacterium]|nr:zinc finger domain-containing protein [Desulfobulbaceae bacterium]
VSELSRADSLVGDVYISELPGLSVAVAPACGDKCERCWTRSVSVGENVGHPTACQRCLAVLTEMGL